MIHETSLSRIGNTPLVEISKLNPYPGVRILAKIESVNPGGSIKDRVALAMIEAAEKSGELTPDKIILEATSGNTGVGLAMVAAIKGYRIKLLMPETASEERKMIMRAYGADIQLTPGRLATDGAIEEAYRLARKEPDKYVLMDQYNNPASIQAHCSGTAQEIWDQTEGMVTHAVSAMGTTGTVMGLAKRLGELNPEIVVAGVEPYAGHKIQGLKNMHESYPPGIYDKKQLGLILHVDDNEAFDLCRKLASEEGIFSGMSTGAALGGALKLASTLKSGLIVAIFPDSGERYLSTPLFASKAQRGVRVFNVATGRKKALAAESELGLFTIGPSLDNHESLDAWRRIVLLDVLARFRRSRGLPAKVVVGLADLDDRTLAAARERGLSREKYAQGVKDEILERALQLGIGRDMEFPLASASVDSSLDVCRRLLAKGLAYEKLRSVYFDVFRDQRYGELNIMDVDKLSAGKTVDLDDYVKDNPRDFTLLKRASLLDLKRGEVVETEWGNVRPSWFLQHAAVALDYLDDISLFLAGETHRFPHMDNLRALWSVAGKELDAWMVEQPVFSENGESMTYAHALELAGGEKALRMWLLSSSYRKTLAATENGLAMWARNWKRIQEGAVQLIMAQDAPGEDVSEEVEQAVFDLKAGLSGAVEDDLSMQHFWPVLFKFVKDANGLCAKGRLSGAAARACLKQLRAVDMILGILDEERMPVPVSQLPEDVFALVGEREEARKSKDFDKSDELRDRILDAGWRVEDAPGGARIFRV